jgi:hypothetical protein
MNPFPKENAPDFSNPAVQQAFVQDTKESKTLIQKELDVNQAEQNLLQKRISLMKSFINDIPSSDPQYSMLAIQIEMDQVELDELKSREILLQDRLQINFTRGNHD